MLWVAPRCWIPTMTFKWCQCLHYQFTVLDHVIRASDFKNYDEMDWKICHIKLQSSVQYISFSSSINKRRHCRMRSWFSFFYQNHRYQSRISHLRWYDVDASDIKQYIGMISNTKYHIAIKQNMAIKVTQVMPPFIHAFCSRTLEDNMT